ncbi:hypothetical protein BGP78_01745 [Pseudoalteromonas sp. MSK9-3]|uniref:hypothetical protein n=1 Tax=Pseudoalteromonas sp. MSK9-3 TaxID=1897633 RepID=UPI000E6D45EE|nr:hypothetical protein [Pseudoalteromonas sp. MSK9-3]RJE76995.1 hypothetical protein BGP78_01745 [Pseudoalteromonas sp. MSK9-3]
MDKRYVITETETETITKSTIKTKEVTLSDKKNGDVGISKLQEVERLLGVGERIKKYLLSLKQLFVFKQIGRNDD